MADNGTEQRYSNVLDIGSRSEFRQWLLQHSKEAAECYVATRRGRPTDEACLWYIDAVEEALCFGWIDSTTPVINGQRMQRFSPRGKRSPWSELNKERVRRLERLGLMTDGGRAVLPPMGPRSFKIDHEIVAALKEARVWSRFKDFPPLYQRVRAYNIAFFKGRDPNVYERMLKRLIEFTRRGVLYGEWNDYGRLCDMGE